MENQVSTPQSNSRKPLHVHQIAFTINLSDLIFWADTVLHIDLVLKEVYRPPEMAAIYAQKGLGIINSLHCSSLAADIMVFVDGVYLPDHPHYAALGERWKSFDPLNRWGGDFGRDDLDHFERIPR